MNLRTKIVATIGPASNSPAILPKLIEAGMNVARLNFSHGNYETHAEVIRTLRSLSRSMNRPIGILLDLQGPKIRVGKLENGQPIRLDPHQPFSITSRPIVGSTEIVSTTYKQLPLDVEKGDTILLDDGLIRLEVASKTEDTVLCRVINGGFLKENKGINLPGVHVSAPSLTEKDKQDVNFGIKNGVDYFALSFVRKADDLLQIKAIIQAQGANIPVIAKIEKQEALDDLDAIIEAADGIMVARGDLGVEMQPELVPTIQKQIIKSAVLKNKPVITATQMLETMTVNPIPTRAEASDVANAILDGTDAVMLSAETASGNYPVQAVQMMVKIVREAEKSPFMKYNIHYEKDDRDIIAHAVAQSAANLFHETDAKCLVVFSQSGKTAKQVSKQRPSGPVYAFTSRKETYHRLCLVWGVVPMFIAKIKDAGKLIEASENLLIDKLALARDDLIVLVIGMGLKEGSTNIIKIHRVGHED